MIGNQATPIPLTLDGQPHTISRPLEPIAASAPAGARYTLQLTGGTQLYGPVRSAAAITFSAIRLELPVAGAGAVGGPGQAGAGSVLSPKRTCLSRRRFSIRVRGSQPRVTVAGKRVRVRRGRAVIDLRGRAKTVKVKVVARRKGKIVRETRRYRTCASRQRR